MKFRHWDINTLTQIISLGPALLLTALLISFLLSCVFRICVRSSITPGS